MASLIRSKVRAPRLVRKTVPRERLRAMLDDGFSRGLTLVSASAGFGKTTMIADWIEQRRMRTAWLSLDAADADPFRLLAYLCAALRSLGVAGIPDPEVLLDSRSGASASWVLDELLDACDDEDEPFALVLDDWHVVDSREADQLLAELVARRPEPLRIMLSTRADPVLPLARLRCSGSLAEIRTSELRFTLEEASELLRASMGDCLGSEDLAAVEGRLEGWAAGLQLTAIALRGKPGTGRSGGPGDFLASLSGCNRFVLDYLLEEVFAQQAEPVRAFLLRTSILERFSGPLCEALFECEEATSGQEMIERLERTNLFVVPLDDEGGWYRYHHLFAELLRQRLAREVTSSRGPTVEELHRRACSWLEGAGLGLEAFRHAVAAGDIAAALRLLDGPLMPLHSRDATNAALEWLSSVAEEELDRRPELWVRRATTSLAAGRTYRVEEWLQAAETALAESERGDVRPLLGRISLARATLATTRYDAEAMIGHSLAALDELAPGDCAYRASARWILGTAYQITGRRAEAGRVFEDALAASRAGGGSFSELLALISVGELRESTNDLHGALGAYEEALALAGVHPLPCACEAHLGKARILYEWNDLDAAEESGRRALSIARTYEKGIDRFIPCAVFLARIELARGRAAAAAAALEQIEGQARSGGFLLRLPEIAAAKSAVALVRGKRDAALRYAKESGVRRLEAQALLTRGRAEEALRVAEECLTMASERGWEDEVLKSSIVKALALGASRRTEDALAAIEEALVEAESGGFLRAFADEGPAMAELLAEAEARDVMPEAAGRIRAAFRAPAVGVCAEPLTTREREVLALIAQGLSNRQIGERLFLALDSVKGHNRRIFEKLGAQRRTEAVARARELGWI